MRMLRRCYTMLLRNSALRAPPYADAAAPYATRGVAAAIPAPAMILMLLLLIRQPLPLPLLRYAGRMLRRCRCHASC